MERARDSLATPGRPARRPFSMIRSLHAADLLTLANGCCGVAAIFHVLRFMQGREPAALVTAAALVPLAAVFDVLDGRVARWRHESSSLGREMDSLADVVSFGVAPATIAYGLGLDRVADQVILIAFAVCGLARLARYNVTAEQLSGGTGKVAYFEGTPIPTSVVPLGLAVLAWRTGWLLPVAPLGVPLHLSTLLFAVSGALMISTIRIPKP
ncbi:MAG: CDP-diacylglycerol--serine O-phosphatidyltransferase [Candidatus Binatia bacterium]